MKWRETVWQGNTFTVERVGKRVEVRYDHPTATGWAIPTLRKTFDSLAAALTFVRQQRWKMPTPTTYQGRVGTAEAKVKRHEDDLWWVTVNVPGGEVAAYVNGLDAAKRLAEDSVRLLTQHQGTILPRSAS